MPKNQERVLTRFKNPLGNDRVTISQYIAPKSTLYFDFFNSDAEYEEYEEYDEKNDCYWVKDGWWEYSYEVEVVTEWMPLPK